jgi:hypothetical protein
MINTLRNIKLYLKQHHGTKIPGKRSVILNLTVLSIHFDISHYIISTYLKDLKLNKHICIFYFIFLAQFHFIVALKLNNVYIVINLDKGKAD